MKRGLKIKRWAFWSPETREPREWRGPVGPGHNPAPIPDSAIPAMHRRRMSGLSKMAVQAGLEAAGDFSPDFLVFCSQHGELGRTHELLRDIASKVELSPAGFSHSVHNTSAGLYTIVADSRAPSTALASGPSTFAYGWLEAEGYLLANPSHCALLVAFEQPVPEMYGAFCTQYQCSYALGLLLNANGPGALTLEPAPPADEERLPMPPLFMAWALSPEHSSLRLTAGGEGWLWSRDGA